MKESPHSEEGTKCSNCSNNQLLKRSSSLLERNKGRPDSLTSFRPFFTTSACHFNFSHHIPLLYCHSPSTVRERLSCCAKETFQRPFWQQHPTYQASCITATGRASCISWHNITRAMWQLNATLATSQFSGREKSFHLTGLAPTTFRARLTALCSHCSAGEVPSPSVHDSTSLSQSGLLGNRISTCLRKQETDFRMIQLQLLLR